MKHQFYYLVLLLAMTSVLSGQNMIKGELVKGEAAQSIKLEGYNGTEKITIDNTTTDKRGGFTLDGGTYNGMALLTYGENQTAFVALNGKNTELRVNPPNSGNPITIVRNSENLFLYRYIEDKIIADRKKNALDFQANLYVESDKFYAPLQEESKRVEMKIEKLNTEKDEAKEKYPYSTLFLDLNYLVGRIESTPNDQIDGIRDEILSEVDFRDTTLFRTGVLDRLLFNYVILRQRQMGNDRTGFEEGIKTDLDRLFEKVDLTTFDGQKILAFLLDGLKKMGMNQAIDHLLTISDNIEDCDISTELSDRVKAYDNVRLNAPIPDMRFDYTLKKNTRYLSEIVKKNKETLVVFWASWCSHCQEEMPKLEKIYDKLKAKGVEVVAISADTDKKQYEKFTKDYKWYGYCDYKKWDSPAFRIYNIYATPTILVLDEKMTLKAKYTNIYDISQKYEIEL